MNPDMGAICGLALALTVAITTGTQARQISYTQNGSTNRLGRGNAALEIVADTTDLRSVTFPGLDAHQTTPLTKSTARADVSAATLSDAVSSAMAAVGLVDTAKQNSLLSNLLDHPLAGLAGTDAATGPGSMLIASYSSTAGNPADPDLTIPSCTSRVLFGIALIGMIGVAAAYRRRVSQSCAT